jgi:hypothetical protein
MSSQPRGAANSRNAKQQRAARAAIERKKAVLLLQKQLAQGSQNSSQNNKPNDDINSTTDREVGDSANSSAALESNNASSDLQRTEITDDMISETMLRTLVDRIESALPKRYVPAPQQQHQRSRADDHPWKRLPFLPMKRNVFWLPLKEQDRAVTISVTEELLAFMDHVKVNLLAYLFATNEDDTCNRAVV